MSIDYKNFPEPKLDPVVNPRPKGGAGRPVIVAAQRTAIGKFMGSLSEMPAPELGAAVVRQILANTGLASELIDEVVFGCVLAAGQGQNPTRQVLIKSGMDPRGAALTINQVCASGLKSVELASRAIRAGDVQAVLAGGMENMSRAPYLLEKARGGYRLGHGQMLDSMISDGLWDPYSDFHMGNTGELVAQKYNLSREQQDEYAYNSHQKALAAIAAGKFKDEIVPVQVPAGKGKFNTFEIDECPRADTSKEALAKLRPAFVKEGGTVTAGNAPGVNDAAAALLVMDEDFAKEQGLKPIARILDSFAGGLDPAWVMLTPIPSVRGLLKRNPDWKIDDFACVEINEAFSAQILACHRDMPFDMEKLNPCGGAIALGHPIGATGGKILATLIYSLKRQKKEFGIVSACIGGGQGVAMVLRNL